MGDVGFEPVLIVEMNSRTPVYNAPYRDILGTEHQGNLEDSLSILSDGFVLYDESRMFDAALFRRLRETLDARTEHESAVVRKLLREDKTHLFPEIPEAWWWIFFWRLCWNFHYEPDPWFEIKWWVWLEMRGKQGAMNMAGCQNCLGKNIPVMMADGSKKLSQDVRQGDLLMGPDGTPRRVLILHRGIAPLYKITPKIGSLWVCTGNHKLELECTRIRSNGKRVKVTPEEWTKWPASKKRSHKQVHVGKRGEDFKTILRTAITVEPIGDGEFYGWTVDKDNMFLLGNGCITNNSGKSMFGATFPLIQLIVWDRDCKSYLSGPYKSHTDDKVWAELQTQHSILKNHGIPVREAFGIEIVENRNEYYVETDKGKGIIKFVASQEAASVVGSKTKDHSDTSGRKGISLFMVDEYVENVNTEMERGFGNFRSNYNSLLILACNPDPMRALHPNVVSFIDPIDRKRSEMKKDRDFRWRTRKGIVVRFDWNNCPNRIVGKNRWPYLMNEQRRSKQEMESDDVRAGQLDAWPFGSEGANSLTDTSRQTAAGVFSDFHYENSPHMRLFSLDPAFGGDDPAVYTILEVARTSISGRIMDRFVGFEQGYIHGIDSDFVADAKFCEKVAEIIAYRESKGDRDMKFLREIIPGSQVGPMAQGAVEAAHLCIVKGIPFDCFTFDASQRADCYDWIVKVFGHQNLVWWYEGSRRLITEEGDDWFRWPFRTRDDRQHGSRHEKWSDYCGRVITMIWAFACELINNGYLANGDAVRKSLTELGAREVASTSTGKVDVWSKEDIKRGTFQGRKIPKMKSPAWGETLAMGLYFGARFKHAVQLGDMPELSTHFGAAKTDWDDWLDLHERY